MAYADTFNVFVVGPMNLTEKQLHQRTWWQRLLYPRSFRPQEHTIAIRQALDLILESPEARDALNGTPYRLDIPDELKGADIMRDVFNKIDQADLVIADLYLNRPTVYYEVALSHSLSIPVIILARKGDPVAFYFNGTRIYYVEDYTPQAIAAALAGAVIDLIKGVNPQGYCNSPFENFFQAPIVDISAAAGLAAGYYTNLVKDVIFQNNGVLQQSGSEKFYVIRLTEILDRDADETRLLDLLGRATGERKAKPADYARKFSRPTWRGRDVFVTVVNNAVIDLPTPLYSLFHAPRYQRVQARAGHDHPEAQRMQQQMIDAFFRALRRQIDRDGEVLRRRLEVVTFEELEDRIVPKGA